METNKENSTALVSDDIITERLIDEYTELLVHRLAGFVTKLELGIIDEDCSISALGVIIHCMENLELFNDTQKNNLLHLINSISYG